MFNPGTGSAADLVGCPQSIQPIFDQVASSTIPVFQTRQPPYENTQTASSKHPSLMPFTGPTATIFSQYLWKPPLCRLVINAMFLLL